MVDIILGAFLVPVAIVTVVIGLVFLQVLLHVYFTMFVFIKVGFLRDVCFYTCALIRVFYRFHV